MNKEKSDYRKEENVERKKVKQKRDGTETKNEVFLSEFLLWFKVKREKGLIQYSSLFCL